MSTTYRVRPLENGEIIFAAKEIVAGKQKGVRAHLTASKVVERDGQIAAVLRGHSLIFEHEELGIVSEIVGSEADAIARMRDLIDGEVA